LSPPGNCDYRRRMSTGALPQGIPVSGQSGAKVGIWRIAASIGRLANHAGRRRRGQQNVVCEDSDQQPYSGACDRSARAITRVSAPNTPSRQHLAESSRRLRPFRLDRLIKPNRSEPDNPTGDTCDASAEADGAAGPGLSCACTPLTRIRPAGTSPTSGVARANVRSRAGPRNCVSGWVCLST
jgi:hypothetical protein